MRAILVCVDYADILAVTLPYNRHHFDEMWVVTTHTDYDTLYEAVRNDCHFYKTDAFTKEGAIFNKWRALEEGLDAMGRRGWLCIMDADVLWPKNMMPISELLDTDGDPIACFQRNGQVVKVKRGSLCTPMRRMWTDWPGNWRPRERVGEEFYYQDKLPPEYKWNNFPLHPQQKEFAGYTQIFHADDPALGSPPWHQIDWIHAGGADSFFQEKWPADRKIRPPFEVLHLGEPGTNWFGRTEEGRRRCAEIWKERAARKRRGLNPFEPEKIV